MSIVGSGLKTPGRALRTGVAWWLALALVLALAHLVHTPASALADEPCFLDEAGNLICPEPETSVPTGPLSLINDAAYRDMTSAQAAALHRLEEQAVDAVLEVHDLPDTEALSVRYWARTEATGLLQKLVVRALSIPETERTPDQKQVAAWMGGLVMGRMQRGIQQTGAEYAAWAGLNVNRYWSLVNGGASKAELTTFLSQRPQAYSPFATTEGFCRYVPPAPYTDDYQGRTWQTCFTPCTWIGVDGGVLSDACQPPVTMEEFVTWGQARVAANTTAFSDEVIVTSATLTAAASFAGNLAAEFLKPVMARYGELVFALSPVEFRKGRWTWSAVQMAGPSLWEGPDKTFANRVSNEVRNFFRSDGVVMDDLLRQLRFLQNRKNITHLKFDVGNIVWNAREDLARRIQARVSRFAQRVAMANLGFAAEVIVTAFTTAIEETIEVIQEEELPRRIASKAIQIRDLNTDQLLWVTLPQYRPLLRHVFATAVVIEAPLSADCGDQCPAPAPVRVASPTDAHFMVQAPGAPTWTQTSSLRIGNVVDDQWSSSGVRFSGRWFVERWYDDDHGLDLQSLGLHYTNWQMQPETVWPILHEDGAYSYFIVSPEKATTFNLETCHEDHTCWTTNAIHYLNPDGNPRTAFLEPYQPPAGAPTASALAPLLGHAVTFNAGNFAPGDPRGMVTYRWRFQKEGCLESCTIVEGGRTVPDYSAGVAGPVVTRTWQTAGSYQVELTATDAFGHTAVKTLTVNVSSG